MQVIAGVLAWITFVPLIELVRAGVRRLSPAGEVLTVERPTESRSPVAPARHRSAA